ncbi:hypothetical protein HMPREF1013_05330 [Bacillus sp. 2_A_57_CT2]|nr:hypothetical protein HMPREF1013_05330 [Bacillus sp. 2_A_57_CT2]
MDEKLKKYKDRLQEIEFHISTQTYVSSNDGDELISFCRELVQEVEKQQQEIEEWERISDKQVEHLTRNGKEIIKLTEQLEQAQQEIERLKEALFEGEANHFQCAPCQHGESQEKILKRYEEALKRIASEETVTFEQTEVIALRALGEIGNLR